MCYTLQNSGYTHHFVPQVLTWSKNGMQWQAVTLIDVELRKGQKALVTLLEKFPHWHAAVRVSLCHLCHASVRVALLSVLAKLREVIKANLQLKVFKLCIYLFLLLF